MDPDTTFEAAEQGEILRFRDATLIRAEVNRNMDMVTPEGIAEICASLPLMPIDYEHHHDQVVGVFVEARPVDGAAKTGGIIYARRFPMITADLRTGRMHLSVEAHGDLAKCSVCGKQFPNAASYCEHLRADMNTRRANGWVRQLSGMHALGGAVTALPAGTDTSFDRQNMVMIASLSLSEQDVAFIARLNSVLQKYGLRVTGG